MDLYDYLYKTFGSHEKAERELRRLEREEKILEQKESKERLLEGKRDMPDM